MKRYSGSMMVRIEVRENAHGRFACRVEAIGANGPERIEAEHPSGKGFARPEAAVSATMRQAVAVVTQTAVSRMGGF